MPVSSEFTATFWGVRGGYSVSGPETVEFGGNTTCLEVRAGPHLIIIDAGTGIIGLGAKLLAEREQTGQPVKAVMLFTHGHHDHTQGLPFFSPLRHRDSMIHVYGPQMSDSSIHEVLTEAMHPSVWPGPLEELFSVCQIRTIQPDEFILLSDPHQAPIIRDTSHYDAYAPPWAVRIETYFSRNHPKGGTMCYAVAYRGKRLVFATDTEGYEGGDTELIRFADQADLLVHDAEYTDKEYTGPPFCRQGWGHSTWHIAVEVGQIARVKRLALTHHNAGHNDAFMRKMEAQAQAVFDRAFVVREGMTISL